MMMKQETVIEATKGWRTLDIGQLWRFRELFYFLAWRDIKVRYKQTALGILWAIFNPLIKMLTFAFLFGRIARVPSEGIPYILITLTGTLVWNYFSEIVSGSSSSVLDNTNLISKVYFPRLIIPLSVVLRALLDLGIAMVMAAAILLFYRAGIRPALLAFPLFILLITVTASGVGLWASAMSAKYRDVAKILPHFIQIAFFLTPVAYLSSAVPEKFRWLYYLNPVAGAIDGIRWAFLGTGISWGSLSAATAIAGLVFISGLFYYRRLERTFADVI